MKARTSQIAVLLAALALPVSQAAGATASRASRGLIVAVSEFNDPALTPYVLEGAENDARKMEEAFLAFAGPQAEAVVLSGRDASLARVVSELERLQASAEPGERIMLYFSAHGSRIPDTGPIDETDGKDEVLLLADAGTWDGETLPGALTDDAIARAVRALRARGADVFLVIDSCASGGAMRSGRARAVRSLPPAMLSIPERTLRSAVAQDANWIEDDMPPGSGRLVAFSAAPTYAAAWDTADGGVFTLSLAMALGEGPEDFVGLAQAQQRISALAAVPAPRSEISGAIESAFFFSGAVPDLVARASGLPSPAWSIALHAAAQEDCDSERTAAPRELDPEARQRLDHCDAVMLSVTGAQPGYVDAWYVDSAGQRTLLSPIEGLYLDGRSPANLSFTFITRDPETGETFPRGTDRLLLLQRSPDGGHDGAATIEFAVAPESARARD